MSFRHHNTTSSQLTKVPVEIELFRFPSAGDSHWHQFGNSYEITCKNHQYLRWHTKNPWERNLYFLPPVSDPELNAWMRARRENPADFATTTGECVCPFADLRVLVDVGALELISSKPVPKRVSH